jgi:hypothetical protein
MLLKGLFELSLESPLEMRIEFLADWDWSPVANPVVAKPEVDACRRVE